VVQRYKNELKYLCNNANKASTGSNANKANKEN